MRAPDCKACVCVCVCVCCGSEEGREEALCILLYTAGRPEQQLGGWERGNISRRNGAI